jgi:AcrR family transcriptional regulator
MAGTVKHTAKKPPPTPARTADEGAMPSDGRAARAVRTRTAIVDALLSLLEEGDLQPPANRIAERAGISLRLIYHHFGDLESLFSATATREAERLAAIAEPIDAASPLHERIDNLVEQRAKVLEWITPVRRASLLQEPFSEELTAARQAFYAMGEQQVHDVFAAELSAMAEPRRTATAGAIHAALMWGFWNDLRISGRSPEEATAAVRATVQALLGTSS